MGTRYKREREIERKRRENQSFRRVACSELNISLKRMKWKSERERIDRSVS